MVRPTPPQTAPVSTGRAREDVQAEGLAAQEVGDEPLGLDELEEEGLRIEDPAAEEEAAEDAAAADAAALGLSDGERAEDEEDEAPPETLVLSEDEERYLEGHDPNRNRGLPRQELEHLDDWDDQSAEDQENLPDDEQQG
jgi:hypothetical protein